MYGGPITCRASCSSEKLNSVLVVLGAMEEWCQLLFQDTTKGQDTKSQRFKTRLYFGIDHINVPTLQKAGRFVSCGTVYLLRFLEHFKSEIGGHGSVLGSSLDWQMAPNVGVGGSLWQFSTPGLPISSHSFFLIEFTPVLNRTALKSLYHHLSGVRLGLLAIKHPSWANCPLMFCHTRRHEGHGIISIQTPTRSAACNSMLIALTWEALEKGKGI